MSEQVASSSQLAGEHKSEDFSQQPQSKQLAALQNKPIGVFDSGLGGLTAVRELKKLLPGENIVYFGDTGRVPYGSRGKDVIIGYAKQDIAFLLSKDVKTIVAACGTVSSTLPQEVAQGLPVSFTGVVQPAAKAAAKATRNGKVGVIGTSATVASGSYQNALRAVSSRIQSVANACPLFVPLVENGHIAKDDPMVLLAVAEYLAPIKQAGVDALIMGCTHYPLLFGAIEDYMGPDVALIDAGSVTAKAMRQKLKQQGLLSPRTSGGTSSYYVTDEPGKFDYLAHIFLGDYAGGEVRQVEIENYHL